MKKLDILFNQLKYANERWKYLESERMRLLEIFLSFIGVTAFGLLISNEKGYLFSSASIAVKTIIPIIYLLIGLCFFVMFVYREIYFRITKTWIKRIEEEIQIYFNGNDKILINPYDGSYYPYYYKPSKEIDFVTGFLGLIIIGLTILTIFLTCSIFIPDKITIFIWISIASYIIFFILIISYTKYRLKKNRDKYPPELLLDKKAKKNFL